MKTSFYPGKSPLIATVLLLAVAFSLRADTIATNPSAGGSDPIVPAIKMAGVPMLTAVEQLTTNAGINYLVLPALMDKWAAATQPGVTLSLTNVSRRETLRWLLSEHHAALLEDPVSNIAFIVPASDAADSRFPGLETNSAWLHTNRIPLIQFADVPMTSAIKHLARQENVNYLIDLELSQMWSNLGPDPAPEPRLTFHLEDVTAWSVLSRTLSLYDLTLVEDPVTSVACVTFADAPRRAVDAGLADLVSSVPASGTNAVLPLIQFSSVPLSVALETLARQAGLKADLDPRLEEPDAADSRLQMLTVSWTNLTARQALVALCENYGLAVNRDDATGVLQIKPREIRKHHHLRLH